MRYLTGIIAVLAVVIICGCAAQNETAKSKYDYKSRGCYEPMDLDANHDGELTTAEAVSFYTEEFYWFDQDDDGVIALDEVICTPEEKLLIDTDNNKMVTKAEYVKYWSEHPCKCGQYT